MRDALEVTGGFVAGAVSMIGVMYWAIPRLLEYTLREVTHIDG